MWTVQGRREVSPHRLTQITAFDMFFDNAMNIVFKIIRPCLKYLLPRKMKKPARRFFFVVINSGHLRFFYVMRLRRLAARRKQAGKPVCLHLGSGLNYFKGWINIDFDLYDRLPDIFLDLTRGIPLLNGSVDYIYAEDFIEHLDIEKGRFVLSECSRILKNKNGVMRLLTPDLKCLVMAYVNRSENELAGYRDFFGCETFGEMLNRGLREWGHQFLYDEETLTHELRKLNLNILKRSYNFSEEKILRGLDSRSNSEGSFTMYLDCYKHESPVIPLR